MVALLLLLLLISLGWKSAIHRDYSSNLEDKIRSFLARNHFIVTVSEEMIRDKRTFRATKAACRMLVTEISPRGWERDSYKQPRNNSGSGLYRFRRKDLCRAANVADRVDFLWYKLLSELGLNVRPTPLFAVMATKSCDAERLPWYELGSAGAQVEVIMIFVTPRIGGYWA